MITRRRTRQGRLGNCRGQSLVEFAFAAIFLSLLLFAILDAARMLLCYTTIANAARAAARYAIANSPVPGSTSPTYYEYSNLATAKANIAAVAQNFAAAAPLGVSPGSLNVDVTYPDCLPSCSSSTTSTTSVSGTTPGNRVSVTVSYVYHPLTSYFSFGAIDLSSTSEGRITW